MIALVAPGQINSVLDGFVYGALVGLGFQVVENIVFALNAVGCSTRAPTRSARWSPRSSCAASSAGCGATPCSPRWPAPASRTSWCVGTARRGSGGRGARCCSALASGVPLPVELARCSPTGRIRACRRARRLAGQGHARAGGGLALLCVAERREADYYAGLLARLADPQIATHGEIATLVARRRRAPPGGRPASGWGAAGARAVRRLQRAQAQLAVELSRDPGARCWPAARGAGAPARLIALRIRAVAACGPAMPRAGGR